ncbi:YgjV family protein [Shewanella sp. 10N.261.52.F9]|uniref:YgjV family protein n=1 Tax=Shewanella sp. 10N.261.52.F9 TaxID=3229684 RepID=UPI0035525346
MSDFILSQWLIVIAMIADLVSFQFKRKSKIVSCLCFSGVIISCHFALLEQCTAALLMLLAAFRYFVTIFSHSKRLLVFFLLLNTLAMMFTFSGGLSLLSFAGSTVQTIAAFCQHDRQLRQLMLFGTSIWLINNILVDSPAAIVMELLFIGSNLIGYYRHYNFPLTSTSLKSMVFK